MLRVSAVSQRRVLAYSFVVPSQIINHDLCFFQRLENLVVEQFIIQPAAEALVVLVLRKSRVCRLFLVTSFQGFSTSLSSAQFQLAGL